ncbi:HNH endonuclease [Actinomycetospora cinnamomea]|uniref:HNH endonuclease n=2 Tax=Actinomycetospora cinnamomea TaxID=663609 RepID=A0A2U1FFM4_9PSEU|nr:HNH endonuclease [Actinomycetospora cinnamomea]
MEGMRQLGRAERLVAAQERDGDTCLWCARPLTGTVAATTDHVVPKIKGGPSWLENEVAACRRCNGERGHRGAVEWLEECERRGWCPDAARLERVLASLAAAIVERGGQRRARPHLDAQLRRLRKRLPSAA